MLKDDITLNIQTDKSEQWNSALEYLFEVIWSEMKKQEAEDDLIKKENTCSTE